MTLLESYAAAAIYYAALVWFVLWITGPCAEAPSAEPFSATFDPELWSESNATRNDSPKINHDGP